MSTDELITRARKAIETGQPNLAQLYMRKALEQTNQQRRELNPIGWQARQMVQGFNGIAASLSGLFTAFQKGIGRAIEIESDRQKSDYALLGPSK